MELKDCTTLDYYLDSSFVVPDRFANKNAIVIGGAMGIGGGVAQHLGAEGANVLVVDWNEEWGRKNTEKINAAGGNAVFFGANMARENDARALVETCVAEFGSVDVCANIAGVGGSSALTADYPADNFADVMQNNVGGIFLAMKYEIAQMLKQGNGGNIVNASSVGGFVGVRYSIAYIASKHAILGLTRTAATEYGEQGIRVNAICPHVVMTPMVEIGLTKSPGLKERVIDSIPMRRTSNIDEVARMILFLLSDECPFATGQSFTPDGGWLGSCGG
jgi:NAD(P)-dependent dehydrogenase (short-subunit alcohol dehydrogenase family)